MDNGLISLLARADSPKVCVVRREAPLRSLSGLALSRAIAPHPYSRGRALSREKRNEVARSFDDLAGVRRVLHERRPRRPASGRREPLEDASLPMELIPLQIVPDVIGLDTIIRQVSGETVQREGRRRDPQRAAVPGPNGIVVPLAGHIAGLRAAAFHQNEGDEEARVGRAPATDELLRVRRERP